MKKLVISAWTFMKWAVMTLLLWVAIGTLLIMWAGEASAQTSSIPVHEASLGERDPRTNAGSTFDPFVMLERMEEVEASSRRQFETIETVRKRWPWVPEEIQLFILRISNKSRPTADELQAAWLLGELATSLKEAEQIIHELERRQRRGQ